MRRIHWGWVIIALILAMLAYIASRAIFQWDNSLAALFTLAVVVAVGVVNFIANFRQAFENAEPDERSPLHPQPPDPNVTIATPVDREPASQLPELFSAITFSVLGLVAESLDIGDISGDAASLAYQSVLARTYCAFARNYPRLTAKWFDPSFIVDRATPELAKLLTRVSRPDPIWLAELSIDPSRTSAYVDAPLPESLDDLHLRASVDFLRWLDAELRTHPVFQSLFHSPENSPKNGRNIDELVAEFAGVAEIAHGYENALSQKQGFFVGSYTALKLYWRQPDSVLQRVQTRSFMGRDWLKEQVDSFVNGSRRQSGALVITGDAGTGKTAFAAHLVETRGYPCLFADQVGGELRVREAIHSLSVQLIVRYRLELYTDPEALPNDPMQYADFLENLLRHAAARLTRDEKIVIVCDGLDEAGTAPDGNVFGLPRQLPDGVYFILTRRPAPAIKLNMEPPPVLMELRALGEENLADVRAYLANQVRTLQGIADQLVVQGYSENEFVEILTEKSGGLWIYLKYVLVEIVSRQRYPLMLEKLPFGLTEYYAQYWADWRWGLNGRGEGRIKWKAVYAPLLCMLAVAQEPMPAKRLAEWNSLEVDECKYLLSESWRPFLREQEGPDNTYVYALYHASMRDFVLGKADRSRLQKEHDWIVRDLVEGTAQAHERIVEWYRAQCDGNWPSLVGDDYARQYLSLHLVGAGNTDDLFRLVALDSGWAKARYRIEGSYAGFLNDLTYVWQWAEEDNRFDRQIRCALIESSLRSLAETIPYWWLDDLVKHKAWSSARALGHVSLLADLTHKRDALSGLIPVLPVEHLDEAWTLFESLKLTDLLHIRFALENLIDRAPEELQKRILTWLRNQPDYNYDALGLLRRLAGKATSSLEPAFLATINELEAKKKIVDGMVIELAKHASELTQRRIIALVCEWCDTRDSVGPAHLLGKLVEHLSNGLKVEALRAAQRLRYVFDQAVSISLMAPHLPAQLQELALEEALDAAQQMQPGRYRAEVFGRLAKLWSDQQRDRLLFIALTDAWAESRLEIRIDLLRKLAKEVPGLLLEALESARKLPDPEARLQELRNLSKELSP
ncbi:MAG: AAA family ATPase, partial [Chloroflexi bacterium]|nr:AAA family ATPase [Chloroflexota bacterium]